MVLPPIAWRQGREPLLALSGEIHIQSQHVAIPSDFKEGSNTVQSIDKNHPWRVRLLINNDYDVAD